MGELLSLNQANIPTYQASHIAVQDFWQLVRVSILNFAVLVGLYIFSKEDLFTHKGLRLISMLLLYRTLWYYTTTLIVRMVCDRALRLVYLYAHSTL